VDYQSVINYLFSQLANYQKVGATAYKPGLDNIKNLLSNIGDPHKGLKTIHVAGTNGKGSVSHILASILIENGYKVGLFTSPHIKDFRERIKINGKLISEDIVVDFISKHKSVIDNLNPSFFEITTAMAFSIFKAEACDISIIETGLGGRLDSTNVVLPEVSVITNIGIDHTAFLGTTLPQIAKEKAGIIKQNVPVVIGEFNEETFPVFKQKADECKSEIILATDNTGYKTDLLGRFQQQNIATAISTIQILSQKGWYIDPAKTKIGLTRVKNNTQFAARLDQISSNPRILVDASHNSDGVKNLFKELKLMDYNHLHCVYGTSSDKDVDGIMMMFENSATYYLTSFESERSMSKEKLKISADRNEINYSLFNTPVKALSSAKQNYKEGDLIIVFGSFFLLEKII
jgi:dihydrofolate synthase/folylpolyglutamate synthase